MSGPLLEDDKLLVEAYCDGELDAAQALALERRMAHEPQLQAHQERVMALRAAIQRVPRERASGVARAKILAAALGNGHADATNMPALGARYRARRFDFRQLAASVAAAAVLASGGTALVLSGREASQSDLAAIIAGHQRALLATSAYDIASSDRHTVKPWFDTKLAISPSVPDLGEAGFPLLGGRVDVVGGKAVPTMVYRRRGHLISVVAVPAAGAAGVEERSSRDGFQTESWRGQGFVYTAVSDIAADELAAFCEAWRREAAAPAKS